MLPIFAITGHAVWFVVSNVFTLFRLAWLPLAVFIAASYGLAAATVRLSPGLSFDAVSETPLFGFAVVTELLLMGLALSVVAVAVHRIILFGDRSPGQYFAFPFGMTELRYVAMGALTFLFIVAIVAFFALGIYALIDAAPELGAKVKPDTNPWITLTLFLLGLVTYFAVVWVCIRLTVWPPAVVANNRLSFAEAWSLSRDQFWALVGLMIASSLAFIVVGGAIAIVVSRIGDERWLTLVKDAYTDGFSLESKVKLLLGSGTTPERVLAEFLFQFFTTTYTVAVLSYAYKALKGFDPNAPINETFDLGEGEPA